MQKNMAISSEFVFLMLLLGEQTRASYLTAVSAKNTDYETKNLGFGDTLLLCQHGQVVETL